MSRHSLEGVWGKLDRADQHLKGLESELGRLIQSDAYAVRGQIEDEGTQYVMRSYVRDPDLMPLGLVFGDAIQNMRTALDHLLCQLVVACGREPTKQHQFPINTTDPALDPSQLSLWKRRTRGVKSPYIELIEHVQPYNAEDAPQRPLAVLADFSNADKHRVVLPVVLGVSEDLMEALRPIPRDLEVRGLARATISRPLENGAEVLRVPVRVTGPNPHMEVYGHVPLDVAFGERLITTEGIGVIRELVRQIVKSFEVLLEKETGPGGHGPTP